MNENTTKGAGESLSAQKITMGTIASAHGVRLSNPKFPKRRWLPSWVRLPHLNLWLDLYLVKVTTQIWYDCPMSLRRTWVCLRVETIGWKGFEFALYSPLETIYRIK